MWIPMSFTFWEVLGTLKWGALCVLRGMEHVSGAQPLRRAGGDRPPRRRDRIRPARAVGLIVPEDRPTANELIASAAEHLVVNVRPALGGHGAFEALIAANLLAIALRELELGPDLRALDERDLAQLLGHEAPLAELEARLVEQIREGELDDRRAEVLAVLRASVRRRLRIANPEYEREEA